MKIYKNIAFLTILSLLLISCQKKNTDIKPVDDSRDTKPPVEVETTPTNPYRSFNIDGVTKYDICCNPADLNNPESLLSERVILFTYDQATVESKYRDIIAIHARYLSQNPSARVVLEGHADERGTPEYNLALGEKRGNSVANLLRAQGASSGQVSVVSFGEERPAQVCSSETCWSKNRRVKIEYTAK